MSNSTLAKTHYWTNNFSSRNGNKISKIIIHHMAGNLDAKGCYNVWKTREASAHYAIDRSGNIGQLVDEKYRAWSVANALWDSRAVTIELANSSGSPDWKVTDATLNACIKLVADIAYRNGMSKITYTGDTDGTLCMHRWFMATSCPGPYVAKKMSYIATEANKLLALKKAGSATLYRVRKTWADSASQAGAYSDLNSAKKVADQKGLSVFDNNGKLVYTGKKATTTTTNTTTVKKGPQISVDGNFGYQSIKRAQQVFGTPQDGRISGQLVAVKPYIQGINFAQVDFCDGSSSLVKAIQKKIGWTPVDGRLTKPCIRKIQKWLGVEADGYWGVNTSKAFQKWLNTQK